MIFGYIIEVDAQVKTTDSIFIQKSRPIKFIVNKIDISEQDRQWITNVLIPELKALGEKGIVIGRATASPEGPLPNNQRLADGRRKAVDKLLASYGISTDRIRYDVVAEDYPLLHALMKFEHDPMFSQFDSIMGKNGNNTQRLKLELTRHNDGKLWQHILKDYFPLLRAVRIMAINRELVDLPKFLAVERLSPDMLGTFTKSYLKPEGFRVDIPVARQEKTMPRRELLSVKTNLLLDLAYMPGYDRFCPIPNVAVEYYPLHGHFTYGASFDGPWWQNYEAHKYFQLRNYQLHTRYYLRSGDIALRKPGDGAAFKGLFFSAYAHAYIYNICFGEKRGWEGEGWGTGLGIGYSMPLGKSEHWRLEIGAQAGFLNTRYDPYQWLCPVDADMDKQQYYYKWYGNAKDFRKRQHRYTWLGPTRVEITLSYDLLYRKNKK